MDLEMVSVWRFVVVVGVQFGRWNRACVRVHRDQYHFGLVEILDSISLMSRDTWTQFSKQ